jgi:site-specific recombinase XerD
MDYREDAPSILKEFLTYHETVKDHSKKTVDEYFLDLRMFFRYIKLIKNKVPRTTELEEISIMDVDLDLIRSVTLSDVYDYLSYLSRDRVKNQKSSTPEYGIDSAARARKVAAIRSFYKYLTVKAKKLEENPVQDLDAPKIKKNLPRYLSESESVALLSHVGGRNQARDFCILTLFLNCGLRISELVGLNYSDIHEDSIRITGKGNKVRMLYLNQACQDAVKTYLPIRREILGSTETSALFLTAKKTRISVAAVHKLVKKHLLAAGLDAQSYSSHKLRHTAATLLLHSGVDVRTLQEILGHDHLNTTQIYTHVEDEDLRQAAKASPLSSIKPPKPKPLKDQIANQKRALPDSEHEESFFQKETEETEENNSI